MVGGVDSHDLQTQVTVTSNIQAAFVVALEKQGNLSGTCKHRRIWQCGGESSLHCATPESSISSPCRCMQVKEGGHRSTPQSRAATQHTCISVPS